MEGALSRWRYACYIRGYSPFLLHRIQKEVEVYSNSSVRQRGLKEVGALGDKSSNLYQRIFFLYHGN